MKYGVSIFECLFASCYMFLSSCLSHCAQSPILSKQNLFELRSQMSQWAVVSLKEKDNGTITNILSHKNFKKNIRTLKFLEI